MQLFDRLKAEKGPGVLRKVVGVAGDVALPDLGLSAGDRQLLRDRVNIVVHAAATIRFDESLKKAVLLNTRGVKLMLQLAAEMKNLEAFLHISTAYCHLKEKVLYEKPYPPPADPHSIIYLVENTPEDVLESMTKKILGDLPNTYAFTKALGEGLVNEQMNKLPIMILRPSVVIPIWKDPLPGWTDNINGPTGLLIGAGKGVIRTMYCNQKGYADFLPVDIAVNAIMICAWNFICCGDREHNVIHLTSSSEYQVSWSDIIEIGRKVTERIPLNNVVWYPGGSMKTSKLYHYICVLFFHLIPAIFLDMIIFLAGHKPILWRVHRRILKGFEVFEYYANNQWDFKNDLVVDIRKCLNARERSEFIIDGDDMDLEQYFEDCVKAARVYILKEMPETLPGARRHLKIMYWVDVITKIVLGSLLLWTLWNRADAIIGGFLRVVNFMVWLVTGIFGLLSGSLMSSAISTPPSGALES
ncbi:Fatty acyl-CoA reductase [Gryllus bimaculatus]|nr:Fatty acyl-CoA reductase [Gryllus bimaculatus]